MRPSAVSSALRRLSTSAGRHAKPWGRSWFSMSAISASGRRLAALPIRPEPSSNACQWPDMMRRHLAITSSMPAPRLSQRRAAKKAGHIPPILAANTHFDGDDAGLSQFKELAQAELIRSHMLLERGGVRFGLFGMMGSDSIQFTINPG